MGSAAGSDNRVYTPDDYRRGTGSDHVKFFSRCPGNVNNPGRYKGTPVIDFNSNRLVIVLVGNIQQCSKGQIRVSSREKGRIENFPGSCRPSVKFRPIPGGNPLLPEDLTP